MDREERAAALCERVEVAFAEVPMPSRAELVKFDSLDERWCATLIGGKKRSEVTVSMSLIECFRHMPLPAVHYYFPAALLGLVDQRRRAEQNILASLVGYLDQRNGTEYPEFSAPQRQTMIDWLQFVLDNMLDYGEEDATAYDFGDLTDRFRRRLRIIQEQWLAESDRPARPNP